MFGLDLEKRNLEIKSTQQGSIREYRRMDRHTYGHAKNNRAPPNLDLNREFYESNLYTTFGIHSIKNDLVRVTTAANTDRQRPFCQPSWL